VTLSVDLDPSELTFNAKNGRLRQRIAMLDFARNNPARTDGIR
jgi:hypothetical protein